MKDENITIHFELDSKQPPVTDWSRFDAMTEQERHLAALADADCLPASEAQLARARRIPEVSALRHKLNLTQEQFARRF